MTNQSATELYNMAENIGIIETLYRIYGGNFHVSIPLTKATCETGIESLDLSVRSYNALRRSQVFTVGSLVDVINNETLMSFRNLGRKSYAEIKTKILLLSYENLQKQDKIEFFENVSRDITSIESV